MTFPAANNKSSTTIRYERYKTVVDCLTKLTSFDLKDVQLACRDETPSFVTRLVNELERCGWIVREDPSQSATYRWNNGRGKFSASRWLDEKLFGTKNQVIDTHQITVGTLDASLIHPREVFRPAIKDAARAWHRRIIKSP